MVNCAVISGPKNLIIVQSRAIVFNSNNELLLVSQNGKKWGTPGGTLDKHEKLSDLAIQEVYEETGLNVKLISQASFLQGKWHFNNGFWYFNEHIDYQFDASYFIYHYHCKIIGNEILDANWKDLSHDIVKYRKFFTEIEWFELIKNNNYDDELKTLSFDEIKKLNKFDFEFQNNE